MKAKSEKENNMVENNNFVGRGRTQEGNVDYNFWYKFDKQIPHTMRFKQFDIIDNHILYWITQEYFTESELDVFKNALVRLNSYIDEALIIPKDESRWDYKKDLKDSTGGYISLKDNYCGMWNESIKASQDVRIPGTNVILEKGDKVRLISKKNEANTQEVIFEDSNFVFKKVKFYISSKNDNNFDEEQFTWRVDRKPHSKADDHVIDIYIDCHWANMSVADSVEVKYGFKMNGPRNSITEFIKVLQDSLKFAEKVAAYLKVKVINR